ncbi:nucleotide cyclase [Chytridium lagenaria]|nr:nucleotide cyclase [Chytridium lagenaria]
MPFYAVAATIVVLTMIPNIAFFMCGMSTIQDMMRIVWMITIVLGGSIDMRLRDGGIFCCILRVTVIHMDVTSFTVLSSMMRPEDVIALLNILFTQFDEICNSHDVEKILTIGDAYVAMRIPQSNTIKICRGVGRRERGGDENQRLISWFPQHRRRDMKKEGNRAHNPATRIQMGNSRVFPTSQGGEALGKSVRAPAMAGKGDVRIGPDCGSCWGGLGCQESCDELEDLGARGRVDFPFVAQLAGREDGKEALDLLMKLKVRIGVHSGTAFGCLTGGTTKIKYEVVGEAMDVAETMEQRATPGTCEYRGPPHLNIFSTDNAPLGDPMEDEDGLAFVTRRSSDGWVSFELRTRREETAKRQPTSEVVGRSESIYRKERDAVREGKVMMQRVCFEDPN